MKQRETKGERVSGMCRVANIDSTTMGNCPLEQTRITVKMIGSGNEYRWIGGNADDAACHFAVGRLVVVNAFAYGRLLRHVEMTDGDLTVGGQKHWRKLLKHNLEGKRA